MRSLFNLSPLESELKSRPMGAATIIPAICPGKARFHESSAPALPSLGRLHHVGHSDA